MKIQAEEIEVEIRSRRRQGGRKDAPDEWVGDKEYKRGGAFQSHHNCLASNTLNIS